jgi:hypothetical protein
VIRVNRLASAAAAVLLIAATTSLVTAGTANASAGDCAGGANGFTDIPDDLDGAIVRPSPPPTGGYEQVWLQTGTVNGRQQAWAYLWGGSYTSVRDGDQVWMDWTRDGGRTWIQCGPFTSYNKFSITSAAQVTSNDPNWRFRAGASISGRISVTDWW